MITVTGCYTSSQGWWDEVRGKMRLLGRIQNPELHRLVGKDYAEYSSGGCTKTHEMTERCVTGRCCAVRLQDRDLRCMTCEEPACSIVRAFLEMGGPEK